MKMWSILKYKLISSYSGSKGPTVTFITCGLVRGLMANPSQMWLALNPKQWVWLQLSTTNDDCAPTVTCYSNNTSGSGFNMLNRIGSLLYIFK